MREPSWRLYVQNINQAQPRLAVHSSSHLQSLRIPHSAHLSCTRCAACKLAGHGPGAASPFGYPIQYTSFAGTTYNLNAYDGLYCRYALPDSWTRAGALTPSQLRPLVDLTDLTYALLTEITAGEPQGTGLLTIAVIPTGANAGHAGSNFKGFELSDNELGSVIQNIIVT